MGEDTPPTTPPTQGGNVDKSQFRQWMEEYERERTARESVPPGGSQQPTPETQSSIAEAVEAALTRREARQQRDSRLKKLEEDNASLKQTVDELKKTAGKVTRSVFSIFN